MHRVINTLTGEGPSPTPEFTVIFTSALSVEAPKR
jgi:hypothetical protein